MYLSTLTVLCGWNTLDIQVFEYPQWVLEYLKAHSTQELSLSLDNKLKLRIENTVEQYCKGTEKRGVLAIGKCSSSVLNTSECAWVHVTWAHNV